MSRPEYHVDVATTAIPAAIAQPPGGIQTAGFPAHSKFASAWANWLFNYLGAWGRELDQTCLRGKDVIGTNATALLLKGTGSGFSLEQGSGLVNLGLTAGGAYLMGGRRVDLEETALAAKYPTGWTLPNNSVLYGHAREETAAGGSSTGEILISTNASEPGYFQIWTGTTDATDLASQANTAGTAGQWQLPVDFLERVWILDPNNETAFKVESNNTSVFTPAVSIDATGGGGSAMFLFPGPNALGASVSLGAGTGACFAGNITGGLTGSAAYRASLGVGSDSYGLDIANGGTGISVRIVNTSTAAGIDITTTTGRGLGVLGGTLGARIIPASVGTGAEIRSGSTSGNGLEVELQNNTGIGIDVQTDSGADSGSRALRAQAYNDGVAIEAESVDNAAATFHSSGVVPVGTVVVTCDEGTGVHITSSDGVALTAVSSGTGANGNYAASLTGDLTSPVKGVLFMAPQNADPSGGGESGGLAMSTAKGLTGGNFADGTWRSYWHSLNGYACAFSTLTNRTTVGANLAYTVVGTITTSTSGDQIKVAGAQIIIRVMMSARPILSATNVYIGVRVQDTTGAPSTVFIRSGTGGGDNAGYKLIDNSQTWQPICFTFVATVPATGTRSYTLAINRDNAVDNSEVRVRDVVMDFVGTVA